jgi:hypothetical protein
MAANPEALAELVRSGGHPFIKITITDAEVGGVEILTHGLADDVNLPEAFRQLAGLLEGAEPSEAPATP